MGVLFSDHLAEGMLRRGFLRECAIFFFKSAARVCKLFAGVIEGSNAYKCNKTPLFWSLQIFHTPKTSGTAGIPGPSQLGNYHLC